MPIKITIQKRKTHSEGLNPKTSSDPQNHPSPSRGWPWEWIIKKEGTILVSPKSVQTGTRFGKGRFYNDKGKTDYMAAIVAEASHFAPPAPIESPVMIRLNFYLERPTGTALRNAPTWIKEMLKRNPDEFPALSRGGPDVDNLQKGFVDGLCKAGFFYDDGYIVNAIVWKYFVADESRGMIAAPRVEFSIWTPSTKWEEFIKPYRKQK